MIRLTTLCGLVFALAATAAAHEKKDVPKDLIPFQGAWKIVKAEEGGVPVKEKEIIGVVRFKFAGDKLIVREAKGEKEEAGTFSVDAGEDPAHIDLVGPKGQKVPGIYKFDKDGKLTLAFVKGKDPGRPKAFDDKGVVMMVMEKVKE